MRLVISFLLLCILGENFLAVGQGIWGKQAFSLAHAQEGAGGGGNTASMSSTTGSTSGDDGGSVESAMNMSMVLMLASAAAAIYFEVQCTMTTSVHIFSGAAAMFILQYGLLKAETLEEIDSILARYQNFNFNQKITDMTDDNQREAFVTCQQEQKVVADALREIAMLHYMAAASFAVAAAWAMLMEGPKEPPVECLIGKLCNGVNAQCFGMQNSDGSRYNHYALGALDRHFSVGDFLLPQAAGASSHYQLITGRDGTLLWKSEDFTVSANLPGTQAQVPAATGASPPPATAGNPPATTTTEHAFLDFYYNRAMIFAGFAAFAMLVGSMYDGDAAKYDEQANACAMLLKQLDEASSKNPGTTIETSMEERFVLPLRFLQLPLISKAQAAPFPFRAGSTCFIRDQEQKYLEGVPIACQKCLDGAPCLIPTIPAKHPWASSLPPVMQQALQQVGEVEFFTYTGQRAEAKRTLATIKDNKEKVQEELELMLRHYYPQMVARGMPAVANYHPGGQDNLPGQSSQILSSYLVPVVEKIGENYLANKSVSERAAFLEQYTLQLPKMFTPQSSEVASTPDRRPLQATDQVEREEVQEQQEGHIRINIEMAGESAIQYQGGVIHASEHSLFRIISHRYLLHFQVDLKE